MSTETAKHTGFTLIELMIVVVIIGVLAAIAYPSYQNHMRQTRRSDAQIALMKVATQQERFFTECNRYAISITAARTCVGLGLALSDLSPDQHYQLVLVNASATAFTASAGPRSGSPQQSDTECTGFTIDHQGNRGATGSNTTRCWRR